MAGRLEGKVAVITGGGNGIGAASARRFAAEGATVLVADLQTVKAAAVAQDIESDGGIASAIHLDAAGVQSNEEMAAAAVDRYGAIDVVVTAAGVSSGDYVSGDLEVARKRVRLAAEAAEVNPAAALTELDIDDWRRVLDINLTGTLLAIQSTARVMLDQRRQGSIVTIASIAAVDPLWGTPSYPVSKAGVWMLTKNASRTLAPLGIRVNSIGPGYIETNMTAISEEVDTMNANIMSNTPMGRKGTPDEVANVALFLASDEASYVTGELIHPDGGWFTG